MAVHIDSEGVFLYFDPSRGFYRPVWHDPLMRAFPGWQRFLGNYNPIKLGEY